MGSLRDILSNRKRKVQILNGIDGVLESGELLVVLGPPGRFVSPHLNWSGPDHQLMIIPSGCTTMLKTIAGELNGIYLDESSQLNYRGKLFL